MDSAEIDPADATSRHGNFNLLDTLDELAHLPAEHRPNRLRQLTQELGLSQPQVQQIQRWLTYQNSTSGFLEQPPSFAPEALRLLEHSPNKPNDAATPAPDSPGNRIDRYQLLQKIGEGGFATVYMAEQVHPVRRRVALKLLKVGMDSKQVIARFEAERQALAIMDHPNIARVLDAGETESGRPYFVMELVQGIPITEYCDQTSLGTTDRLELFVQVCRAVQHAHQKGVIHRDLKPSNILVTLHDGTPVPKVIDFGIAKATHGQRLTDKTLFTEFRQFVGTPEYMSPEQADISGLDIDTRSDIYSLGVLLYELLTGTTPFDPKELRSEAYGEIQRIIREVEPPKPSTRLSTLGPTRATVAARRGTDPKKLDRLVRGELDWIVMRCLEKDRSRRYETANGLANDVERYLGDEPVLARPPSRVYRLAKFARKHKVGVGAGAAIAATLVLGIIATSAALVRATRAQISSQNSEKLATERKIAAEQARDDAKKAQARAEHEAARARAASNFMREMLGSTGPNGRASDARIIDILERTSASVSQTLRDQPETEIDVRRILGESYLAMGLARESKENFSRAYELARQTFGADSEETLKHAYNLIFALGDVGERDEAEALARKSLDAAKRKLGEHHPMTATLTEGLATALSGGPKDAEAEGLFRELLKHAAERGEMNPSLRNNFALLLYQHGKLEEAEAIERDLFERSKDASLGFSNTVDTARFRRVFAWILEQEDKLLEAKTVLFALLDYQRRRLGDTHPDTLGTISDCADVLERLGEYREALAFHRELLAVDRAKGRDEAEGYAWRLYKTGSLLAALDQDQEAARAWSESLARFKQPRPPDGWVDYLQPWRSALLRLGLGPERFWKSKALRAQIWCAIDEHLLDYPEGLNLDLNEVAWERLRFRLERWHPAGPVGADHGPTDLSLISEGGLSELRAMSDPAPGVYRFSLELPRKSGGNAPKQELWLVFCPWDVALYSARAVGPQDHEPDQALFAQPPSERRKVPTLALGDGLSANAGPAGRTEYFGLIASTTLELPKGKYRFAVTSDDAVRLFVDEHLVIEFWTVHSPLRTEAVLDLPAGRHQLRVEFYQGPLGFKLWLQVSPGSGPPTTMPVRRSDSVATLTNEGGYIALDRIRADLDKAIQRAPTDADAWQARAGFYAAHGRFAEAAADYAKALQFDPDNHLVWRDSAMICLQLGDIEGYRRHCREMLRRFADSPDRNVCERIAKLCSMEPDAVPDLDQLARLADRALALGDAPEGTEARAWRELAKGMVEYRRGEFAAAADWLEKAANVSGNPPRQAIASFILAMAQHRGGQVQKARETMTRGTQIMESDGPKGQDFGGNIADWIAALEARKQAEALLGRSTPTTATPLSTN